MGLGYAEPPNGTNAGCGCAARVGGRLENSCIKSVEIEGAPICRIGRPVGVVVAATAKARSRMVVPRRDQPPSLDFLSEF